MAALYRHKRDGRQVLYTLYFPDGAQKRIEGKESFSWDPRYGAGLSERGAAFPISQPLTIWLRISGYPFFHYPDIAGRA